QMQRQQQQPSLQHSQHHPRSSRRRRTSSSYAMNVDVPSVQHNTAHEATAAAATQNDYFSYATTTAQAIDRWSFNHANIMSNLSQLPPDLLPSLLPQLGQQLQHSALLAAPGISALVAAATAQQVQQAQQTMHPKAMQAEHTFAVPAVPIHRQQQPAGMAAQYEYPGSVAAMQAQQQSMINAQFTGAAQQMQPAAVQANGHMAGAYPPGVQYATAMQPLMVPPPSPTVLSYYTADPSHWISLLGQHTYQPQAYHYDHQQLSSLGHGGVTHMQAVDPSYSLQQQQQHASNGSGLLLTQQYAPPALAPQAHIDQAIHQSSIVAAQMAAASQYASGAHVLQPGMAAASAGVGMQFNSQSATAGGFSGFAPQPPQVDAFAQPARRASSFTNLALLQNQQQHNQGQTAFLRPDLCTQYQAQAQPQQLQSGFGSSGGNALHPASAGVNGRFPQQHAATTLGQHPASTLGQHPAYLHGGYQAAAGEPLELFGAAIKPAADL
ncbi:hypothetical protein LPJ73_006848, partial [Coemansia sp. RSA 2703]